jgi:Zn-dependent protease with chaperone function
MNALMTCWAGPTDWLLTFALHSTVALALALLVAVALRRRALPLQELLLRLALVLPLPSSLLQHACQWSLVSWPLPSVAAVDLSLLGLEWWTPGQPGPEPGVVSSAVAELAATPAGAVVATGSDLRPWLAWMTVGLALAGLGGLGRSYQRLRRLLADREPEQDRRVLGLAAELAQQAGFRQTPQLSRSLRLSTPVAMGWWRPEICLPLAAAGLDEACLRALLAHELAHLRRADPLWLGLKALLQALFPWQPLWTVWHRRWSLLSELQCDAAAVHHTSPTAVARCLLEVASWLQPGRQPLPLASGMAARPSTLRIRVEAALAAGQPWPWPRGLRPSATLASLSALVLGVPSVQGDRPPALPSPVSAAAVATTVSPRAEVLAVQAEHAALVAEVAALQRAYAGRRPDPKIERALVLLSQRLLVLEQLQVRLEAALQR